MVKGKVPCSLRTTKCPGSDWLTTVPVTWLPTGSVWTGGGGFGSAAVTAPVAGVPAGGPRNSGGRIVVLTAEPGSCTGFQEVLREGLDGNCSRGAGMACEQR